MIGAAKSRSDLVVLRAYEQGVRRPFDGLVSMPTALRSRVARLLGVRIEGAGGDPRAEAWRIVNADLRGLQARSHPTDRILLPRRNHNWWEILLATARRLGLDVYPGLSEREVERIVFDRAARGLLEGIEGAESEILELVAREAPAFSDALERLGLSGDGKVLILAAFHRIAQAAPSVVAPGEASSRRTAAYLREGIEAAGVLRSVSRTLRFLRDELPSMLVAWEAVSVARNVLPRSARALALALSALHLHSIVSDCVEELEALRL